MKIGRAAVFSALLLCTCIAFAQAANQNNSFSSTLSGGIHLRAIAGAPFSADVVKESTKALPDGTQVPVVTRGKMFRDAEGRTRSEIELALTAGPRRYVTIIDPKRQVSMVLDQQAKTATVSPLPDASPEAQPAKMDGNRIPA
ncbi:MAG TPA: hypothetical protein VKL99_14475, partial [Candidatus Angelobacter sp.]|nr:hypothetical protein [Candidatus Angelobacter sp.]